jgi:glycerol-3-phosphate O-acyltransferase
LLKESEFFFKIGTPLDVMGNSVDAEGRSYDAEGKEVDLYAAFQKNETTASENLSNAYAKILSQKIVEAYYRIHPVLSSHLIAFVAYELAQTTAHDSMCHTGILIENHLFMNSLTRVYAALTVLYTNNKIDFTPILQHGSLNLIFEDGLAKLGIYHAKQPLVRTKDGDVLIQNMGTLLYYHNRLTGYELEKSIFT